MSGPKITVYTVTPEQKRMLRLQEQAEKKLRTKMKWFQTCWVNHLNNTKENSELLHLTGTDHGFSAKFKGIQELGMKYHEEFEQVVNKGILAELEISLKQAEEYEKLLVKELNLLTKLVKQNKNELNQVIQEKNKSFDRAVGMSFDFSTHEERDDGFDEFKEKTTNSLKEYKNHLLLSTTVSEKVSNALEKIEEIQDFSLLKNIVVVQIKPLLEECKENIQSEEEFQGKFQEVYNEYQVLCEMTRETEEIFPVTRENLEILMVKILQLKEMAEIQQEKNFINQAVQEVLEEMGYQVLGNRDVVKKSGAKFRNELYQYNEGTAVNVTFAENGQIAMELGGLDQRNRLPNEGEAQQLCEEMESFCQDFSKFEEQLANKGVILSQRCSLLPPDISYAQIINVEDYKMESGINFFQEKKKKQGDSQDKRRYME